tara:strand:+ start:8877 stop:9677 length:801 start_codon:yes stop_codon:yes gene_type:complete
MKPLAVVSIGAALYSALLVLVRWSASYHTEPRAFAMNPMSLRPVPKIAYVYTDNASMPGIRRFAELNPEFDVRIHSPTEAREFMQAHCPGAVAAFDALKPQAFKSDVFRYCALTATGGVYIDDDLLFHTSIDEISAGNRGKLLLIEDGNDFGAFPPRVIRHRIWNAFMIARESGSRILACALITSVKNVRVRNVYVGALELTGPEVVYNCLRHADDAKIIGFYEADLGIGAFLWHGRRIPFVSHRRVKRDTTRYSRGWIGHRDWFR